jgi:hypothetical protein
MKKIIFLFLPLVVCAQIPRPHGPLYQPVADNLYSWSAYGPTNFVTQFAFQQFTNSFHGTNSGANGTNGVNGINGTNGAPGINGTNGVNGMSVTNSLTTNAVLYSVSTSVSNLLGPQSITVTGSPFNFTNTTGRNVTVIIWGPLGVAVSLNGTSIATSVTTLCNFPLQNGDHVTITYSSGTPNLYLKPF